MFHLIVEKDPTEKLENIDGFSLGDITISGDSGTLTSKGKSIMIFISLSMLLDFTASFIIDNEKQYRFEGIDSSFNFYITRENDEIVLTDSEKKIVDRCTIPELISSMWRGINSFYSTYRPLISKEDAGIKDLDESIENFKVQFLDVIDS